MSEQLDHDAVAGTGLLRVLDRWARENDADALLSDDRSIASGRTMADIAAGKGSRPKPFMLKTKNAPDAVWNSNRATPRNLQGPAR